jgi:hypothetical protein
MAREYRHQRLDKTPTTAAIWPDQFLHQEWLSHHIQWFRKKVTIVTNELFTCDTELFIPWTELIRPNGESILKKSTDKCEEK